MAFRVGLEQLYTRTKSVGKKFQNAWNNLYKIAFQDAHAAQ
jgi:hypothetical protein